MDSERQAVFRSLIASGRSQGYLIRAEAEKMLPLELIDLEQRNDVFDMIADMGIVILEDRPTDAELAAMKVPTTNERPTTAVPPLTHAGPPIGSPLVVLRVGAEGGEIRLIAQELTTGWRYRYSTLDQTNRWLDEGGTDIRSQSNWVYDWQAALESLDRYPWAVLHPVEVHPRFASRVLDAARARLAQDRSTMRAAGRLSEWTALCKE